MNFQMPPDAYPGSLKLRVKELDRALTFYSGLLGLEQQEAGEEAGPGSGTVRLALEGRRFHLDLIEDVGAPLRPYPSVGLYHFALLLPDRRSLASILRKLVQAGWELEGAADHGVSEALYLRDPERNGIELYRDRPKDSWPFADGRVAMVTDPLDVYGLMAESSEPSGLHERTQLGHMHLHVDDLSLASKFYVNALGLQKRASLPGAEFLAAGDYHHHLGLNTWAGNRRAPRRATGLIQYSWCVPAGTLAQLAGELGSWGFESERTSSELLAKDPGGIEVRFQEK